MRGAFLHEWNFHFPWVFIFHISLILQSWWICHVWRGHFKIRKFGFLNLNLFFFYFTQSWTAFFVAADFQAFLKVHSMFKFAWFIFPLMKYFLNSLMTGNSACCQNVMRENQRTFCLLSFLWRQKNTAASYKSLHCCWQLRSL